MIRKLVAFFFCLAMVAGAFGAGYVVAAPVAPLAAISLTGGVYAQDFDTLVNSGTSTSVPDGWVFAEAGTNANTTYTAGTGSGTAGDTYSFGAISSTERAFGGLQSGSLIPTIDECPSQCYLPLNSTHFQFCSLRTKVPIISCIFFC